MWRTTGSHRRSGRCRAASYAAVRCANSSCRWRSRAGVRSCPGPRVLQASTSTTARTRRPRASIPTAPTLVSTPLRHPHYRPRCERPPQASSPTRHAVRCGYGRQNARQCRCRDARAWCNGLAGAWTSPAHRAMRCNCAGVWRCRYAADGRCALIVVAAVPGPRALRRRRAA